MTYMSVNDSNAGAEARVRLSRSDWSLSSFFILPTTPTSLRKGSDRINRVRFCDWLTQIASYESIRYTLTSIFTPITEPRPIVSERRSVLQED